MRRSVAAIAAVLLLLGLAAPAAAATPDQSFPAGVACEFGLNIYVGAGGPMNEHDFANGSVLNAGRGNALTFENAATLDTFQTPATGAVTRFVPGAEGGFTLTMTGANVLIMFPTDTPAGPSTTLYIGRVVAAFDAQGNTTLVSAAGKSIDICKALS